MEHCSVVIPVKDGARFLARALSATLAQSPAEVLVIDSGSSDGSPEIARAAGVDLVQIDPAEFGHGRTRNLGAERTTGELICFLTQDAEPVDGWLAAYVDALAADERIGAAYGPHLPRAETSPMIARELTEFFAAMAPDGRPALQADGSSTFLSNVNACYRRACWEEIRFPDLAYAEDQAFGRAMLARGWHKAYLPQAAVLHAHDYGPVEFVRRYFDEYRGLRETMGHVESARPRPAATAVVGGVVGDRRWMRARGYAGSRLAAWTARSAAHHAGRRVGSVLGSRAPSLPNAVQRRLSLEQRERPGASRAGEEGFAVAPQRTEPLYAPVLEVARAGPKPLAEVIPGTSRRERLHVAVAIPHFRRGSGGHTLIFALVQRLERLGHTCTIWVCDPEDLHSADSAAVLRQRILEWFAPIGAPVFSDFDAWHGADVALATGWETVHPLATLPATGARAYLVSDHEPEFFPTSAQSLWAAQTYELGFHPIVGGEWLRDVLADRYGVEASAYHFGIDHDTYRPRAVERRGDTVLFYARAATPRRAAPLGLLALEELVRRRPSVRIVAFGEPRDLPATFAHTSLGVAAPEALARAYCEATVGLCLSLTNYSLIPQEMMACGLPCVDLAHGSSQAVFGDEGPAALVPPDPLALADAMERLLDDESEWRRRSQAGVGFVADASWDSAAREVEAGLREALRRREGVFEAQA